MLKGKMINIKHNIKCIILLILVFSAHKVSAEIGTTAKLGTLGYGVDITWGLGDKSNTRLNINMYNVINYNISVRYNNPVRYTNIKLKPNLQTLAGLYDWHPWSNGVRFSIGAMFNNNNFTSSSIFNDTLNLGNDNSIKSVDVKVTFNKLSPYIGFGYGNAVEKDSNLNFSFDMGVLYQGSPKVNVITRAQNSIYQPGLDNDSVIIKSDIEKECTYLKIYPVISLGISYTF